MGTICQVNVIEIQSNRPRAVVKVTEESVLKTFNTFNNNAVENVFPRSFCHSARFSTAEERIQGIKINKEGV